MRMSVASVKRIFNKALEAVLPPAMVHRHLKREGDDLVVGRKTYKLAQNVHITGFGKAVSGMCRAVQDVLDGHIINGVISVPVGTLKTLTNADKRFLLPLDDGKVLIHEGAANNLPDEDCHQATLKILDLLRKLGKDDLVVTLISGGGSALLCSPVPPVTLNDKLVVTKLLAKQGASIQELNTVRKALSEVKGGGIAQAAAPAKMISLILSDVIGDPLDLIASGPTVRSTATAKECLRIVEKYDIMEKIPSSALEVLGKTQQDLSKNNTNEFAHVQNILVGTNTIAVDAAVAEAERSGYKSFVLDKGISGEARRVGVFFIELYAAIAERLTHYGKSTTNDKIDGITQKLALKNSQWTADLNSILNECQHSQHKKICVIGAGETTVTVSGDGKGGRNQEMVLSAAIHYNSTAHSVSEDIKFSFLSAGTDGQDGPTDAAGAVFDNMVHRLIEDKRDLKDAKNALQRNDSYNFLVKHPENILKTGLTGTNVMDLQILAIEVIQ